jgi:preprotein translocase subunit YajC
MNNNIFGNNPNGSKGRAYSKGFYIVLLLCIIAVGITSFVIFRNNAQNEQEIQKTIDGILESEKSQKQFRNR